MATSRSGEKIDAGAGGVVRLLEHLDRAIVPADAARAMAGELPPARPDAVALREELGPGGGWPGPWFSASVIERAVEDPVAAAALPRVTTTPQQIAGEGVLEIAGGDAAIVALVPCPAQGTWLVRARMKARDSAASEAGAPSEPGGLSYVPLRFDVPPFERLLAQASELYEELGTRPRVQRLAAQPGAAAQPWQELRLLARPLPERRTLAVSIFGGTGGVLVDAVEVRRLTPAETLALSPDDSVEPVTNPLRRRVAIDLETWDCLALPAGASATFEVVVPQRRPRLELACAGFTEGAADVLELGLDVEGAGISWRQPRSRGEAAALPFVPASIDLSAVAGRNVRLVLSARGPAGAVALFGAPVLLGTPSAAPPSAVVISLDTLRADHVGCYGARDVATPRIDRLASEGVRFERVLSPASYTLPTHLSLFSGQDPLVHQTVMSTQPMDPVRTAMLAQRLARSGRRTAAFTGGGLVHPRYGFGLGFDSYSIRDPGGVVGLHRRIGDEPDSDAAPGEDRVGRAIDWLERSADVPFFLFLHTYLVHNYRPSQQDLDRTGGGARPSREELDGLRRRAAAGEPAALARMRALYCASVEQADREIVGRLLDAIERLGLAESTLVVLVSDHGEEFFEHGKIGHGDELWHGLTRVPWILRGPGVPRGLVREDPVALADVAPTVAARLRLDADPRVLARDQLAADPDENFAEPKLLSLRSIAERPDQDALVLWPWKLVRRRSGEPPWPAALYHLEKDPGETRDRAAEEPDRTAGLLRRLEHELAEREAALRSLPSTTTEGGERRFELPAELERMLDELGYVHREPRDPREPRELRKSRETREPDDLPEDR